MMQNHEISLIGYNPDTNKVMGRVIKPEYFLYPILKLLQKYSENPGLLSFLSLKEIQETQNEMDEKFKNFFEF